jgi:hypothetical protein
MVGCDLSWMLLFEVTVRVDGSIQGAWNFSESSSLYQSLKSRNLQIY